MTEVAPRRRNRLDIQPMSMPNGLPLIAEDFGPSTLGVSQLSFYCGALAVLGIVQAIVEGAEGDGAIEIALDGLQDEVEISRCRRRLL